MSAPWLSISDAAVRLRLSPQQVLQMAVSGELHSRLDGDHREVCAGAVAALVEQQRMPVPVSELAAHGGDDQTAGPTVRGGPEIGDEAEALYREEKRT